MRLLRRGERVRLRLAGDTEWCEGVVALASSNGKSVAVRLDEGAMRTRGGVMVGVLPLLVDYNTERVEGLTGDEYELQVTE